MSILMSAISFIGTDIKWAWYISLRLSLLLSGASETAS